MRSPKPWVRQISRPRLPSKSAAVGSDFFGLIRNGTSRRDVAQDQTGGGRPRPLPEAALAEQPQGADIKCSKPGAPGAPGLLRSGNRFS
jgi:hypothetical protein